MEEFFYIILLVIWLVISFLKGRKKVREQQAGKASQSGQPKSQPSPPKAESLDEMLEDLFGGGKKKASEDPSPKESRPILRPSDHPDSQEDLTEAWQPSREPAYQSWESSAQQSLNEKNRQKQESSYSNLYEEAVDEASGLMPGHEFEAEGKPQTIEDIIKAHRAEDARLQAEAENLYGKEGSADVADFDLRTAVIFSEVLNKKY